MVVEAVVEVLFDLVVEEVVEAVPLSGMGVRFVSVEVVAVILSFWYSGVRTPTCSLFPVRSSVCSCLWYRSSMRPRDLPRDQ